MEFWLLLLSRLVGKPARTHRPVSQRRLWQSRTVPEGMSAVRDSEERSVSCEWARRRNYAGNYRSCFDHLLVAWAFRISCIHRVISHFARRRPRSPGLPFFVWEKGQHITAGTTLETRSEVARVRCRTISSLSFRCGTTISRKRENFRLKRRSAKLDRKRHPETVLTKGSIG